MTELHRVLRPAALVATALLGAMALGACGNSTGTGSNAAASGSATSVTAAAGAATTTLASPATSNPTSGTPTAASSGGVSTAVPAGSEGISQCGTSGLSVALGKNEGAMSHASREIILTNTSGRTCTMKGYGGYGLYVQGRTAMVANVTRGGYLSGIDPGPAQLTLRPGAHAYAMIGWTTPTAGTACLHAVRLAVTPPNQTVSLPVAFSADVCDSGHLSNTAWSAHSLG